MVMMEAQNMVRPGRGSMRFVVGLRWALLLCTPFFFGLSVLGSAHPLMWGVLLLFALSNMAMEVFSRRCTRGCSRWTWYAVFLCDFLMITVVVILRGGIRTDAYLLYVLLVAEAGILLSKRDAWTVGLLVMAGYAGAVLLADGPRELQRVAIRGIYLGLVATATSYLAGSEKNALLAALTDAKTNLPNTRLFQEALTDAVARHNRSGRPLAVALLDVDNFRQLNGTIGHPLADQMLEGLAEVLLTWKRPGDLIARYGGEEFVFLLPDVDLEGASERLEGLRERVAAKSFQLEGHPPVQMTISIGVSELSVAPSPSALLLSADRALLVAKATGKNRVTKVTEAS